MSPPLSKRGRSANRQCHMCICNTLDRGAWLILFYFILFYFLFYTLFYFSIYILLFFYFLFIFFLTLLLSSFWRAVVTGVVPSPRFLPSVCIAHRGQQSHRSSIFHRVLLTHALALSASHLARKEKSPRFYTSMHSGISNSQNRPIPGSRVI